jgi:hypothetical protein
MNRLQLRVKQAIATYAHNDDPLAATANTVALLVASSQPFYPLYVCWSVGPVIWPTFFTFLSTPFFLAVPALSRLNTTAGRALLPLAGIGNTVLSTAAFGVASGTEIFLIPCALLAALLFRPCERLPAVGLVALAVTVFLLLNARYGAPLHVYSPEEYRSFLSLNAVSAGLLTAIIGFMAAAMIAAGRR